MAVNVLTRIFNKIISSSNFTSLLRGFKTFNKKKQDLFPTLLYGILYVFSYFLDIVQFWWWPRYRPKLLPWRTVDCVVHHCTIKISVNQLSPRYTYQSFLSLKFTIIHFNKCSQMMASLKFKIIVGDNVVFFGAESFIFQFAIQKVKDQDI